MDLAPYDAQQAQRRGDPFSMMDDMMTDMMMPFGGGRRGRGGGPFGGGLFGGGLFDQMDGMMDMMAAGRGGGGGMMMSMSSMGGGAGGFSSNTMMFSSTMGEDGQVHTEKFSSSSVGDRQRQIVETQQAYSNSNSGIDKMSLERQIHDQGRKVVKERSRHSGEERHTDMFRGMSEDQAQAFDSRWQQEAAPHIPSHSPFGHQMLTGSGYGGAVTDGRPRATGGHIAPQPAIANTIARPAFAGQGLQAPARVQMQPTYRSGRTAGGYAQSPASQPAPAAQYQRRY
mmetsp:Transcript_43269/g.119647  ORF Transcript_43269/g.119647 Transcript_43269/m.119647 type:complete len:284 (-) Transcript_43269:162-1013(-)